MTENFNRTDKYGSNKTSIHQQEISQPAANSNNAAAGIYQTVTDTHTHTHTSPQIPRNSNHEGDQNTKELVTWSQYAVQQTPLLNK